MPFLLLPVIIAGGCVGSSLFGEKILDSWNLVLMAYGAILVLAGTATDIAMRHTARDHSFWPWSVGGLLLWSCILAKWDHLEWAGLEWSAFNLGLLVVSVVVKRRFLAALSGFGLSGEFIHMCGEHFTHSGGFGLACLAAGASLIFVGARWGRIEAAVRAKLGFRAAGSDSL
jgi:hypothetical protein